MFPKGKEAALWLPGLPGPDPGNFLYAQKVTKKAPGDPDLLCLPNRSESNFVGALPLNQRFLASDLWRVAYPTSPDGLLKG